MTDSIVSLVLSGILLSRNPAFLSKLRHGFPLKACGNDVSGQALIKRNEGYLMENNSKLKQKILYAIRKFEIEQMGIAPESVKVIIHSNSIVILLRGIISAAEKNCADDKRLWELMQRYYYEVFNVIKPVIENEIGQIVGGNVNETTLSIDTDTGKGVLLFTFEKPQLIRED